LEGYGSQSSPLKGKLLSVENLLFSSPRGFALKLLQPVCLLFGPEGVGGSFGVCPVISIKEKERITLIFPNLGFLLTNACSRKPAYPVPTERAGRKNSIRGFRKTIF
jgi:hypothetical protein